MFGIYKIILVGVGEEGGFTLLSHSTHTHTHTHTQTHTPAGCIMQGMLMYLRIIKFFIMYVCMYPYNTSIHMDHQVLQKEQFAKIICMYVCMYVCNYPGMVCQNKMPTILTFTTASRHDFFFFLMYCTEHRVPIISLAKKKVQTKSKSSASLHIN